MNRNEDTIALLGRQVLARVILVAGLLSATGPAAAQEPTYLPPAERADAVADLVEGYYQRGLFNGSVLAAVGDEVVYRGGVGLADREFGIANGPATVFRLASVTKQFTAAAVLRLADRGLVDLTRPVTDYLPGLPAPAWGDITLDHLLTHTAGIPQNIEELGPRGMGDHFQMKEMVRLVGSAPLPGRPGRQFLYSNVGYVLAAAVIEEVTGKPYGEAMDDLLFTPLRLQRTGHETSRELVPEFAHGYVSLPDRVIRAAYEDKSYVTGAGSLRSTVDDLFLWSRAMLDGRVLSDSMSEKFTSKQVDPGYAYGWFTFAYRPLRRAGDPAFDEGPRYPAVAHSGGAPGFSTALRWYLEHDISVIVLANQEDAPTSSLANKIGNVLLGLADTIPPRTVSPRVYEAAMNEGVDAAVDLWRRMESTEPDSLPGAGQLNSTGYLYLRNARIPEAVRLFELQVAVFPDNANAHDSLGEAYLVSERPVEAMAAYRKAIEIDPDFSHAKEVLDYLAGVLRQQTDHLP